MRLFVFTFLVTFIAAGQSEQKIIYVNNKDNVFLFFDNPIRQGNPGHSNFVFAFDLEEQSSYGIVKGKNGIRSNLHIITDNGNVFTFILKYKETLSKYNYFFKSTDAISNINGTVVHNTGQKSSFKVISDTLKGRKTKNKTHNGNETMELVEYTHSKKDESQLWYNRDRKEYYRKFCSDLRNKRPYYKRLYAENNDIAIYLQTIDYNRNELYFKLRVKNKTGVDYITNFVSFSKIGVKDLKKSTSQSIAIEPLYTYNAFKTIPAKHERIAIYVFKKFGINRNKIVQIELNEKDGERNVFLNLRASEINNPN